MQCINMSLGIQKMLEQASPLHIEFAFYCFVRWVPPWWSPGGTARLIFHAWEADVLDVAVVGREKHESAQHECRILHRKLLT
jgi:hypothetical protein